jgi:uncharacterized membrane protein YhhN
MKTKHQYLLFFYWLALFADCYLIYSKNDSSRLFTKGALMPLLLIYFLVNASKKQHLPSKVIAAIALVLAWAGDLVLLQEQYFITGLVLFVCVHIAYIIYFLRVQALFPVIKPVNVLFPLILVATYDLILIKILLPFAGALKDPLIAYMAVISLMFVFAFNVKGNKNAGSIAAQFFIPGAAVFIVSDSVLALNKYIWEDHMINMAVILTYGYAQQLLVHGFIKHVKGGVITTSARKRGRSR